MSEEIPSTPSTPSSPVITIQDLQDIADVTARLIKVPYVKVNFRDVRRGKARIQSRKITIPSWIVKNGYYYILYYVAHEVCHFHSRAAYYHGEEFKRIEGEVLRHFGLQCVYAKSYPKYLLKLNGDLSYGD